MVSLACDKRLSLRNQYDTKTPRASFLLRSSNRRRFYQGESSPAPREAGTCSRHEKNLQRGFRNVRPKFLRKIKIRKIPSGLPNHRRTCASLKHQSHFKRSTWARGPQAVRKDSCLGNTLWKTGGVGQDPARPVRRGLYRGVPLIHGAGLGPDPLELLFSKAGSLPAGQPEQEAKLRHRKWRGQTAAR